MGSVKRTLRWLLNSERRQRQGTLPRGVLNRLEHVKHSLRERSIPVFLEGFDLLGPLKLLPAETIPPCTYQPKDCVQ